MELHRMHRNRLATVNELAYYRLRTEFQQANKIMAKGKNAKNKSASGQHRPESKEERKIRIEKQQQAREQCLTWLPYVGGVVGFLILVFAMWIHTVPPRPVRLPGENIHIPKINPELFKAQQQASRIDMERLVQQEEAATTTNVEPKVAAAVEQPETAAIEPETEASQQQEAVLDEELEHDNVADDEATADTQEDFPQKEAEPSAEEATIEEPAAEEVIEESAPEESFEADGVIEEDESEEELYDEAAEEDEEEPAQAVETEEFSHDEENQQYTDEEEQQHQEEQQQYADEEEQPHEEEIEQVQQEL